MGMEYKVFEANCWGHFPSKELEQLVMKAKSVEIMPRWVGFNRCKTFPGTP